MSENQSFFKMFKYRIDKFLYFFYGEKFFKKIRYDWGKFPKRYEILQNIIDLNKYKSYLEIGCDKNQYFSFLNIDHKVGVDPVEGGNIKTTSDNFFSTNKENFDMIFIDGLHEYSQVMKDIQNSLKFINRSGVILLHDCLLRTIWNQITPRINSDWNGDVWKAIVECRTYDNIDTYTCIADRGIGIIFKRKNRNKLSINITNFKKLSYKEYFLNHNKYMNLVSHNLINELFND